jgi:hypothetical protein
MTSLDLMVGGLLLLAGGSVAFFVYLYWPNRDGSPKP